MEHTLCGTDTLKKITDQRETDSNNRMKTPPQATLGYSKTTTKQKAHILLISITEEMVA